MRDTASFGSWLRERRQALDLTQAGLAGRVGCSVVTIRKLESNSLRPSREMAGLVARALEVAPGDVPAFLRVARAAPGAASSLSLPPAAPPVGGRTNLPGQPTTFIGRRHEIARARALIYQATARLVTLTGAPGSGKTRLALEVASSLRDDFADGVFFVPLAAISDPALLVPALAAALDVKESGARPLLLALKDFLRDKTLLLVLDNFEHLAAAAPVAAELLAAAPRLKALVTSRSRLRLQGERELVVPSLALPDLTSLPAPERLTDYEAVRLFVERAQDVDPEFAITPENAQAVAEICARLDGLPLAIELAAARIRILPPAALVSRLTHRLAVLTGGARDLPARHQTVRAAVAWSYDLLDPAEQQLFRWLGVFADGFGLPAVEAVCAPEGDLDLAPLDGMESLAAKSLLKSAGGTAAEPRYCMLETIREYALEQLAAGEAEAATIPGRYARYYLDWLVDSVRALEEDGGSATLEAIRAELGNIRAAWQTAASAGQIADLARALEALERIYDSEGRFAEAEELFALAAGAVRDAGAAADPDGALLLGRLLARQGAFRGRQGRLQGAEALLRESLRIMRPSGAAGDCAYALQRLGGVVAQRGAYAEARGYHEESLALARAQGDPHGVMHALNTLGLDASKLGDYTEARRWYGESLAIARGLGDRRTLCRALNYLGYMLCLAGAVDEAEPLLEESLDLCRDLGDQGLLPYVLGSLGEAYHRRGAQAEARRWTEESLAGARQVGDQMLVVYGALRLGWIAVAENAFDAAEAHFSEALRLATEIAALPRALSAVVGLARVRVARGDLATARAWLRHVLAHPALEAATHARAEELLRQARQDPAWAADQAQAVGGVIESLVGAPLPPGLRGMLSAPWAPGHESP
jgi:predicted ATPase/transcriptional regulator with XRE-family HTH domain